jgi:hypothetical protein
LGTQKRNTNPLPRDQDWAQTNPITKYPQSFYITRRETNKDNVRYREKNGKLTRRFANRVKQIRRKEKEELIWDS